MGRNVYMGPVENLRSAILRSATQSRTMSSKAVLSLCLSLCFITTTTTAATASECLTTAGNVVGAACVFPFTYGGTTYHSCTTAGGLASWCYTEVSSAGVGVTGKYGDCGTGAARTGKTSTASECITTAGKVVGAPCVSPFTYGGTKYSSCTTAGGFAPWCYTEVSSAGVGVTDKYGDCGTSSACTGQSATAPDCITTGGNVVGAACVFPFTYGGTSYSKCTTAGGFASWCYTEVSSAGVGVTG